MQFTQKQDSFYNKAALLCSRYEKCTSEVMEKLQNWGLTPEETKPVVSKLIAEKYIDDERFARAYVKDKFRFNHWGKQKIKHMLQAKHISPDILKLAFDEIEDETYASDLRQLLKDKDRSVKAKDDFDRRTKLMRFALGRGFETGLVIKVLKEIGAGCADDE